jgi:hypothetical protein
MSARERGNTEAGPPSWYRSRSVQDALRVAVTFWDLL